MTDPAMTTETTNDPSVFLEEGSKNIQLELFDQNEELTRGQLLYLLGQFLRENDPHKFETIAQARAYIHGEGKKFPENVGSTFRLRRATRGVMEKGIDYFPDRETKKRQGVRKTKITYIEICNRHRNGESVSTIAELAGVSRKRIRQIINELF